VPGSQESLSLSLSPDDVIALTPSQSHKTIHPTASNQDHDQDPEAVQNPDVQAGSMRPFDGQSWTHRRAPNRNCVRRSKQEQVASASSALHQIAAEQPIKRKYSNRVRRASIPMLGVGDWFCAAEFGEKTSNDVLIRARSWLRSRTERVGE